MRTNVKGVAAAVAAAGVAAVGIDAVAAGPSQAGPSDVKNVPAPHETWVKQAAGSCDAVNAPLLAAQIEQESEWDNDAVSSAGAEGIAQFKPDTWAGFGVDANQNGTTSVKEPEDAIVSQGAYMCHLANEVGGVPADGTVAMLWAYDAGPEATKAANGQPPTAEADNYARRIIDELIPKYRP